MTTLDPATTVLVTMGTQGVLRYDSTSWERVGVLSRNPAAMPGPTWLVRVPMSVILSLPALAVLFVVGDRQRWWFRPRSRWYSAAAIVGVTAAGLLYATGAAMFFVSRYYPIWSAISVGVAIGAFAASIVYVGRRGPAPPPPPARFPPGERDLDQ